ncbi:hypothetical protein [Clostridium sp. D53t1_180928_C8]|uniref:hypothetical protein n=1 Tax=Clostridium sp. D53t1_180928_C8 TaxID=2787101 RepID=UPI0018A8E4D3|nr:hypothetical protein [Clostridium sp. D53t1_180928_C8]
MKNKRIKECSKPKKYKKIIIRKISNPTKKEGNADGFIPGGDRANGYAWAMAESKNYIYIGSNRNIIFSLIKGIFNQGNLAEIITNIIFKGDVSTENTDSAAEIFRYNKLTKKIDLVYKSETSPDGQLYEIGYRSAVTFKPYNEDKESVYIGGFGSKYARILKFKEDYVIGVDKPEVVFIDNTGSSSIRAMIPHEDKLYFGLLINDTDLRIMESASPSENTWNIIAELKDFNNIPSVDAESAGAGGIFDLISYNGYLYAIIGSGSKPIDESGFLVFKGKYLGLMAEGTNSYGWKWEMIVGPNAKYEAGMGVPSYAIATPFKYKAADNKEYVYIGTFSNVIQTAQKLISFDFSYLYKNFVKPTQLYRFDENDNWEMVVGTPQKGEPLQTRIGNYKAGFVPEKFLINYSSNHYTWRMAEYNGKLFLGTFDSSTLYDYFVPKSIPNYIDSFDDILKIILEFLSHIHAINSSDAESILNLFSDSQYFDDIYDNKYNHRYNEISLSYACSHYNEVSPSDYLEEAINNISIKYDLNILNFFKALLPKELNSKIESLITDVNYVNCRNCLNESVLLSLDSISEKIPTSMSLDNDKYLRAIYNNLSNEFGESASEAIEKTIDKLNSNSKNLSLLLSEIEAYFTSTEFLKQIYYMKAIRRMIDNSKKGFNLYMSNDGINFYMINNNGFNDKFNYGLRTFLSSEDGFYIGTANPFYGGQLWRLNFASEEHC